MKATWAGCAIVLLALPLAGWAAVSHADAPPSAAGRPGAAPFVTVPLVDGGPAIAGPPGQPPPLVAVAGSKLSPHLANALLSAPPDTRLPLLVDLVPPKGMLSMGGDFYAPRLTEPRPDYPADILDLIDRESRGERLDAAEHTRFSDWALQVVLANNRELAERHLAEWAPRLEAVPGVSNVDVLHPALDAHLTLEATPDAVLRMAAMPEVGALVLLVPLEVRPFQPIHAAPSPAETLNG